MSRGKLVFMSLLLFICECQMSIAALQQVLSGSYSWLGNLVVILACTGGLGFSAFLFWYALAIKRPAPKDPFDIPEASVYISDPFFTWCRENEALIKQYYGCHLAISPTRGILIVARTDEEFERALETADLPEDAVITHADMLLNSRPYPFTVH